MFSPPKAQPKSEPPSLSPYSPLSPAAALAFSARPEPHSGQLPPSLARAGVGPLPQWPSSRPTRGLAGRQASQLGLEREAWLPASASAAPPRSAPLALSSPPVRPLYERRKGSAEAPPSSPSSWRKPFLQRSPEPPLPLSAQPLPPQNGRLKRRWMPTHAQPAKSLSPWKSTPATQGLWGS